MPRMGEDDMKGLVISDSAHAQRQERVFAHQRAVQAPTGDARRHHRRTQERPRDRSAPRVFAALTAPSFGQVAEFQKRGAVHCHAMVRLDGPDGPRHAPPAWATVALLDDAIRAAAARVPVPVPAAGNFPSRGLRWSSELDVQPIGALGREELTEQAVASYAAKFGSPVDQGT
ncbi:hypothetical protein GCM10017776_32760 [Streptomyces griseoluteus]|nr:hypothetical protein GCM10017776_32760 [Streptomyces griseoluteus]